MDPFTSLPINNMIGCLLYGITVNFIGFPQINNDLTAITLVAMKLHNMKHFDEYFNEFLHRLHTLSPELILEPKWKEIFVSSLPLWVSTTIVSEFPGSIGDYKFGVIRQAVKAIIVELCSQMKIARAATNPKKPHGYQQLCKQWHLSAPKNSGGRDVRAYRKKKHTTKSFLGKKIIHQKKPKDYKQTQLFTRKKEVQCYHCNKKGHISPNCPELGKEKKKPEKGEKKVFYINKSDKVNCLNLPDSCEEITSEEESDYINKFNSDSNTFDSEEEYCNDPHCAECF